MTVANKLQKDIINNWSSQFVNLSVYSQNKLYGVCGPFLYGIEILKLPRVEEYRPIFVFYPLWKIDIKSCLDEPVFIQEIYDKKGMQLDIPYRRHIDFFKEVVECTREQVPILASRHLSVKQLFELFDRQFLQILIKASPVGQAKLFEAKLFASLYLNDMNEVKQVLFELNKVSMSWSPNMFEWKYGKLDAWFQNLQEVAAERDMFLKRIEANTEDKKIAKLQRIELHA